MIHRDIVRRAIENCERKCFKGFKSYEDACLAWQQFIVGNILPTDTVETLSHRRMPHPIAPLVVDDSIAGLHLPPAAPSTLSQSGNTSGVTVHIHTNVSNASPRQTTHISRSQSQPASHSVGTPQSPNPPPYSMTPAGTPSAQRRGVSPMRPLSPTPSRPGPSTLLRVRLPAPEHHLYFIILIGQAPGVYMGRRQAMAALGPLSAAKYDSAATKAEADAIFVSAYMSSDIARLSE
jgi:hypothetical protein